jgi:hypothetical protein
MSKSQEQRPEPERTFDPILFSMLLFTAILLANAISPQRTQVTQPADNITRTSNR